MLKAHNRCGFCFITAKVHAKRVLQDCATSIPCLNQQVNLDKKTILRFKTKGFAIPVGCFSHEGVIFDLQENVC